MLVRNIVSLYPASEQYFTAIMAGSAVQCLDKSKSPKRGLSVAFLSFYLDCVMLLTLIGALIVSFAVTIWLLRYQHVHSHLTHDHHSGGPQKFHAHSTPRVGGIPIFFGLLIGALISVNVAPIRWQWWVLFMMTLIPAFIGGLAEDLTKKVGPRDRLLASFFSAALAWWLLHARIDYVAVAGLDAALAIPIGSLLFTMFAVGGVAHAVNIIDGYNGLAGMVVLLVTAAIAYVAFKVADYQILAVACALFGATLGFWVWNFPRGMIFAGDGGAYLWGFVLGVLSVLLIERNTTVSPWFPLVLMLYPVWETLFSIYRKKFLRGQSPGTPDGLHFHMMVYKRLVRWMVRADDAHVRTQRNSMTAPYLWGMALLTVIPAVLFWSNTRALMWIALFFVLLYIWLYRRMVTFRSPRWLVMRRDSWRERVAEQLVRHQRKKNQLRTKKDVGKPIDPRFLGRDE